MSLWTPADITTALWLDASDSSTITTVSGAVSQWNDKSANAYHVTQGTASARPLQRTAELNGLNTIECVSDDFLVRTTDTNLFRNISNGMMFAVAKPGDHSTTGNIVDFTTAGGTTARARINVNASEQFVTGGRRLDADSFLSGATGATSNLNAWNIASAIFDFTNTDSYIYRNGTLDGSQTSYGTSGSTSNTASGNLWVGQHNNSEYYVGQIAEVIIVHSDISTATRQKIEGYLAHKWGLAGNLPSDHPYKSVAPAYIPSVVERARLGNSMAIYVAQPGSNRSFARFGNINVLNDVQTIAPGSIKLNPGFGVTSVHNLLQIVAPASIANFNKFGAVEVISSSQVIAPGSILPQLKFGALQVANLLQIASPGSVVAHSGFGVAMISEPSFSVEVPIEITIEANEYMISLPVEITVESPAYLISLPLEITVEASSYTGILPVQIFIDGPAYTGSLPVEINVFTPGNLDGDWLPEISLDGVEIDYGRLVGPLRIVRQRGVTASAEFTYVLEAAEAAVFELTHFKGKQVIIDAVSGSMRRRRFTGKMQTGKWDQALGLVTLFCTDTLEEQLIDISLSDVAGFVSAERWSDVVFGELPERGREYLDHLQEIEPVTVQCDVYDMLSVAPLVPVAAVATLTPDTVVMETQSILEVDDKQIINRFEVELTSRGAACYGATRRIHYRMGSSLPRVYGSLPAWLYSINLGGRLMDRGMIEQALDSTDWHLLGDVTYVPPPLAVNYSLPSTVTPGALSDSGSAVFYLQPPSIQDQFAIEFTASLRREWGQTVEVKDKIIVEWRASIATYGLLTEKEAYLADTDFDVQEWGSSKDAAQPEQTALTSLGYDGMFVNGNDSPVGGISITGTGYGMEPHMAQGVTVMAGKDGLGWEYSEQAVACIVKRCQNQIYSSHLGVYEVELMKIAPELQLGDGMAIGAGLRIASASPLPIEQITDTWDFDAKAFYTSLSLGYIPVGDAVTEASATPQAFPVPVFGSDYLTVSSRVGSNPVAYYGETEEGENKMEITLAGIDDAYRETDTLDRTATPLTHGVWAVANNLTITAIERA